MALNTGYAIRTGAYEPGKQSQTTKYNNNTSEGTTLTIQEEALARYNAAKVNKVYSNFYEQLFNFPWINQAILHDWSFFFEFSPDT